MLLSAHLLEHGVADDVDTRLLPALREAVKTLLRRKHRCAR